MERERSKFFYCYSFKLKDFLKQNGMSYITKAINPKTKTPYFLFEKSEELDRLILLWNDVKIQENNTSF